MTLRATRIDFIELSGRYDLVVDTTSYGDNGADRFIRIGQRWLSRTFEIGITRARWFNTLAAGDWYALVPSNRTILEVWMSNSTDDKWMLDPLPHTELIKEAPADPATIDRGQSLFWAKASIRTVPEVANSITVARYGTVTYSVAGDHWDFNGIIWLPPIDRVTTLEVYGEFYHPTLNNDNDTNFWTEEESHILVMAACRALEQSYRNHQGMADWELAIKSELIGSEFDFAHQESVGGTSMEGQL